MGQHCFSRRLELARQKWHSGGSEMRKQNIVLLGVEEMQQRVQTVAASSRICALLMC